MALSADRPGVLEVVGVVTGCLMLLIALVRLDGAAYDREMARARTALAERTRDAARQPQPVAAPTIVQTREVEARTESLGARGPIAIPVGGAWSAGTTSAVAHVGPDAKPASSSHAVRRIVGPTAGLEEPAAASGTPAAGTAATSNETPATAPVPAAAAPASTRRTPADGRARVPAPPRAAPVAAAAAERDAGRLALMGLAGIGALMALGGAVILGRAR